MPGVLIVEDDNELREMLKISLIRRKYTVLEAANGKEAITHFKPSITDLVVTDLIMPEEDGLKVIMKLRELKPSLKDHCYFRRRESRSRKLSESGKSSWSRCCLFKTFFNK